MRVLLWHLDGKLPNLALMRIAAHHRERGDRVELRRVSNGSALDAAAWREVEPRFGDPQWDRVYSSAIFERTRPLVDRVAVLYPGAELGGTGTWSIGRRLADVGIDEDGPLDYSSYPATPPARPTSNATTGGAGCASSAAGPIRCRSSARRSFSGSSAGWSTPTTRASHGRDGRRRATTRASSATGSRCLCRCPMPVPTEPRL